MHTFRCPNLFNSAQSAYLVDSPLEDLFIIHIIDPPQSGGSHIMDPSPLAASLIGSLRSAACLTPAIQARAGQARELH